MSIDTALKSPVNTQQQTRHLADPLVTLWDPVQSTAALRKSETAHLIELLQLPLTGRLATRLQQAPCVSRVGTYNDCMRIIHWPAWERVKS